MATIAVFIAVAGVFMPAKFEYRGNITFVYIEVMEDW